MKPVIAASLAAAILLGPAAQACTPDELTAKIQEVSARIQALAQRNPQQASEWSQRFQAQQGNTQPKDLDAVCKLYDDMLASLPG